MKRKIFHIFPYEKFTDSFVDFINRNFNQEEHVFWIYGGKEELELKCLKEKNVIYMPWKSLGRKNIFGHLQFLKHVREAEKIIIHGFWLGYNWTKKIKNKYLREKVYICFWGGDIYNDYSLNEKSGRFLRKFIENACGIITLTQGDYYILKEKFNIKGTPFLGQYAENPYIQKEMGKNKEKKKTDSWKILLGNSASNTNCHEEMLDKLAKYKDKNIEIYVPLSYGNKDNARKVIEYGKKVLGSKFIPIENYMDPEKYGIFLSQMDIGIFYNNRQQAMGNINALLSMKAKLFLRKGTTMWDRYTQEIGCYIYDAEEIGNIEFEHFINLDTNILEENFKAYVEYFKEENIAKKWENIFGRKIL